MFICLNLIVTHSIEQSVIINNDKNIIKERLFHLDFKLDFTNTFVSGVRKEFIISIIQAIS